MKERIVEDTRPVTLIGGGTLDPADLEAARALAPQVVAADGGADSAMRHGVTPDVVVGDLDSISAKARAQVGAERLLHVPEQDTTDFDKALRAISAPVVVAVGFTGARLDHQLAALHVLVQPHPTPCVLVGEQEILFHLRVPISVATEPGEVVSLFPMQTVRGRSEGLEWPIGGLEFHPARFIGTSNCATGSIQLEADGPGLVVILPKRHLAEVVSALGGLDV